MNNLTLTELTQRIAYLINGREEVTGQWVIAELSDFRLHGQHAYGQLIEKNALGQTIATLRATIWKSNLDNIQKKFKAATGQGIASGMKVSLKVSVGFHPAYGIAANITDIDPAYSLGDMERIRREILDRLEREGLKEANKQIPLTPNPQRLAVISAAGAAGYGDFMQQLSASPYAIYPLLLQATMQGDRTVPTVLAALDAIEENLEFWDCAIIIRGGGATNDLNSFDNYELARRVATFPIPVIVGIGHERDNTVLDYIAHTRCKTPTAVAAFIHDTLAAAEVRSDEAGRKVLDITRNVLTLERQHLSHFAATIPIVAPQRILNEFHRIERIQAALTNTSRQLTNMAERRLQEFRTLITAEVSRKITRADAEISNMGKSIADSASARLTLEANRLESTSKLIAILSPDATLQRGYSITRVDGHAVRNPEEIPPGAEITTTLAAGSFTSVRK